MSKIIKAKITLVAFFLIQVAVIANAQELSDQDNPEAQKVEAFQVFDNLYYVGAKWVAAWLLETDQGLILFDTLYGDLTDLVIDGIRELGFEPDDVRYVIVTHAHYDHIGGARRFQEEFGSVVMMSEADWQMTEEDAVYRNYPKPIRHLSVSDGSTLNLGRVRLRFMVTPGHTPGVLSTRFTVYHQGYPHVAFTFGGVGLNFSGVQRTEAYINSVTRLQQLPNVEVNIPNHQGSGEVFERYEILKDRRDGDPHPFVDPESWSAWLDILLLSAEAKLNREKQELN
ncbi:MAG: MBL fold metallo-hydrolase [Pseudomonadales bacterium]|nr:MBL fold metallo-hydrolase [Pseudomonadales bacterium]